MSNAETIDRPMTEVATPASFRDAMRALAGSVCVIALGEPGARAGFTATAVCSLTAEPPRLLVCVSKTVSSYERFLGTTRLSVNILSRAQEGLAKRFAGMLSDVKGENRFTDGQWVQVCGAPVMDAACASFVCQVAERVPQSTHTIFICDVIQVARHATPELGPSQALLYADGRFTGLAT